MDDEKYMTMRSPKMTSLSPAMASSRKDSPNMASLDKNGAESKYGPFQSIYEMQFLNELSKFDLVNHD